MYNCFFLDGFGTVGESITITCNMILSLERTCAHLDPAIRTGPGHSHCSALRSVLTWFKIIIHELQGNWLLLIVLREAFVEIGLTPRPPNNHYIKNVSKNTNNM